MLIEELSDFSKDLQETQELCIVHGPWRRKEEILPFITEQARKMKETLSLNSWTSILYLWN